MNVDLTVLNHTNVPVRFEHVRCSCTCSAATLNKKYLQPNERAQLDISANLTHRTGPQTFTANLVEPAGRVWQYNVETTIYERARFDNRTGVFHLGNLDAGTDIIKDIPFLLHRSAQQPFPTDLCFKADRPDMEAILLADRTTERLEDGSYACKLAVRLKHRVPKQPGNYYATLTCHYVFKGEQRSATLSLTGYVLSLYEVMPKYVVFGHNSDDYTNRRIFIRRTDGKPIHVENCQVSVPAARVTPEFSTTNDRIILLLSVDPKAVQALTWGEVTLTTSHELQPSLKIPFAVLSSKGEMQ